MSKKYRHHQIRIRRAVVALNKLVGEGGGGGKVSKKCRPKTEKILGFEWPKTAQMAFKFFYFFRNIFKYVQDFSCLSKQFFRAFSIDGFFKKGFFIEIQRYFCLKCKDLDLV